MERSIHPSGSAWAEAVAAALVQRVADHPALRMCLATGSTPRPAYAAAVAAGAGFGATSILLLDEFGDLPPDEPASCDRVLRTSFVDGARPADYRTIDTGAADLDAERAAIDAWIDAGPGGALDLAVLGLGVNGHLGMNEPGSPVDGRTARVDLAASTIAGAQRYFEGRAAPTWGVTVGLADLLAAREVWVLATGRGKSEIVARATEGPATTDVPASLVQLHPNVTWWLDPAAAERTGWCRRASGPA